MKRISDEKYNERIEAFKAVGKSMQGLGDVPIGELYPTLAILSISMMAAAADSLFCIALELSHFNDTMEDIRQDVNHISVALRNVDDRLQCSDCAEWPCVCNADGRERV